MFFEQRRKVNSIERAHVRCLDYNPKREHILVSNSEALHNILLNGRNGSYKKNK